MVPAKRDEIYLAKIRLGASEDIRPWVVIDDPIPDPQVPRRSLITVAPISSQFDLFRQSSDFAVDPGSPDYASTGLKRKSYVIGDRPARICSDRFVRKLGKFSGAMLQEFRAWCADS